MQYKPNYRAIHLFLNVAAEGSFSAAAERLGISQPTLSQQIAKLEQELGWALFHRGGRQLTLTAAGQALHRNLGNAFEDIDSAWSEVRSMVNAKDSIVIASVHTLFSYFLPDVLESYLPDFPSARPDFRGRSSSDVVRLALSRGVDLGLVYDTQVLNEDLQSKLLFVENIVIVYHPDAPWAAQVEAAKKLNGEIPVIGFQKGYALRSLLDRATQKQPLNICAEVDNVNLTLRLIQSKVGAALLPKGVAETRATSMGLAYVELEEPRLTRSVVAIWRQGEKLRPLAEAFLERCRQVGKSIKV